MRVSEVVSMSLVCYVYMYVMFICLLCKLWLVACRDPFLPPQCKKKYLRRLGIPFSHIIVCVCLVILSCYFNTLVMDNCVGFILARFV